MKIAIVEVNDFGGAPFAEHNVPCAVCTKRHAVLALNVGVFEPCWDCQKEGWELRKRTKLELLWERMFG